MSGPTADVSVGKGLILLLRAHVLEIMSRQRDCAPDGLGLRNSEIEALCDLALNLDKQDSYLTYSVLMSLVRDGHVLKVGEYRKPRYLLGFE
jgi:hypothetical protein